MTRLITTGLILLAGCLSLQGQFTRKEYYDEYVTMTTGNLAVVKIATGLFLAPEIGWNSRATRIITPIVTIPTVGFTITKTIELRFCKFVKMAPGWFVEYYSPRMRTERIAKRIKLVSQ